MNSPEKLNAKSISNGLVVKEYEIKQFPINELYQFIGEAWGWTDKLTYLEFSDRLGNCN